MPRIPIYDGPQIDAKPLPTPYSGRIDVSSGAESLGRGVANIGAAVKVRADKDDLELAFDAEMRLTDAWSQWNSASQPNYTGANAKNYEADAAAWWNKAREQYATGLRPGAQRLVNRSLMEKRTAALMNVRNFSMQEQERHSTNVLNANVQSTVDYAVENGAVDTGRGQVIDMINAFGKLHHLSPEEIENTTRKALTQMHTGYAQKLIDSDPLNGAAAAETYIAEHSKEIDNDAEQKLRDVVKAEGNSQFARQFALDVQSLSYAEQVAKAQAIKDPDRQRKALNEVDNNDARNQRVVAHGEREAKDQAYTLYLKGEPVPESLLQRMDPISANSLISSINAKASRKNAAPTTVPEVYAHLNDIGIEEYGKLSQQGFAAEYAEYLSPSVFQRFSDQIAEYQSGGPAADAVVTDEAMMDGALDTLKLKRTDTASKKIDQRINFERTVQLQVSAWQQANPDKKLQPEKKQEIIDSVVKDRAFIERFGVDYERPTATMNDEEFQNAYVSVQSTDGEVEVYLRDIPPDISEEAAYLLSAQGKPASSNAIAELYQAAKDERGYSPPSLIPDSVHTEIVRRLEKIGYPNTPANRMRLYLMQLQANQEQPQ